MVKAVRIFTEKIQWVSTEQSNGFLFDIKHINGLVGKNNSGKSRLLRLLFSGENDEVEFYGLIDDETNFNTLKRSLRADLQITMQIIHRHGAVLNPEFVSIEEIDSISMENSIELLKISNRFSDFSEDCLLSTFANQSNFDAVKGRFGSLYNSVHSQYLRFGKETRVKTLYIPILRGLRPIQLESDSGFSNTDSFHIRTNYDYFASLDNRSTIYTGLSMYNDIMKLLLGTEQARNNIYEFEKFLERTIFKCKVTLIPKYDKDVLHIKLGNKAQHEIFNLGDGLQTIITILFPVFMRRKDNYVIFIEEPENHLHPEWQHLLLNALKEFGKHTFFLTTHSSTFINDSESMLLSIQNKNNKTIIRDSSLERKRLEILNNLGYKASDLFQTNFILWVEGPSDRIYLNYWISKIDDSLKEGVHYSIMFFNGDNYRSFLNEDGDFDLVALKKLNQNCGIILDSDREGAAQRFNARKKRIVESFEEEKKFNWLTKYREIENYFPFDKYKQAVEEEHNVQINLGNDPYTDRCRPCVTESNVNYKSRIRLPDTIFSVVQRNGNGKTSGISARDLRREIENAIRVTANSGFNTSKVNVAKRLVNLEPDMEEPELRTKMNELVRAIQIVNT